MIPFAHGEADVPRPLRPGPAASQARRGGGTAIPQVGAPTADELAALAVDLARAAAQLAETADALVEAPPAERAAVRATLYRWQTILRLGARRLLHAAAQP